MALLKAVKAFCKKCVGNPKNCADTERDLYPHRLGKDIIRFEAMKRVYRTGRRAVKLPKKSLVTTGK